MRENIRFLMSWAWLTSLRMMLSLFADDMILYLNAILNIHLTCFQQGLLSYCHYYFWLHVYLLLLAHTQICSNLVHMLIVFQKNLLNSVITKDNPILGNEWVGPYLNQHIIFLNNYFMHMHEESWSVNLP
jgi:hypothetical protein